MKNFIINKIIKEKLLKEFQQSINNIKDNEIIQKLKSLFDRNEEKGSNA